MLLKQRKILSKIRSRGKRRRHGKQFNGIRDILWYYCMYTSFHGLRYVVDSDLHIIERFLWLVLFVVSTIIASTVIYTLAFGYQAAPTSISIASMNHKISSLPFPSVTFCLNDRIDWDKVLEYERKIFPNDTENVNLETFRKMLGKLSMISFGDFDELDFLKNENTHSFKDINLTEMLRELMPRCDELLSDCWWHNTVQNCCEIFEVQRTEYGFCYSFNSEVADREFTWNSSAGFRRDKDPSRPRRTTGYGDWSGIKVTIHLGNATKPPDSTEINGIILMMNEPHVWPNSGTLAPSSSFANVALNCISGFATERVLNLEESKMPCKYDETGLYNQETCLSICKRDYVIETCGCNPSFLFPLTSHPDCTVKDLDCLIDYNNLYNEYIVAFDESRIHSIPVMLCDCPPECDYYLCNSQFSNVPLYNVNDIMLDVHYIGQTSFRYKTDIVITQQDLLVSFGSIISLFLGGSLLSVAELLYYLSVAVFSSLRTRQRAKESTRTQRPMVTNNAVHGHTAVLPILDYGPLKTPSWKIPIFTNYNTEKWNLNRY